MKRVGLDLGSTTVKCVVMNESGKILFHDYKRHMSKIAEMSSQMLGDVAKAFPDEKMYFAISGSAGMGMANDLKIPFVQEVYATRTAVKYFIPKTDVVIELGGEDAKILFFSDGVEVRMNGSCAGGTGAFIDQMTTLMGITQDEMNALAKEHTKIYTIASRCGVFAKSDIQPLINQGAKKEDISASILYAVVNQTVGGLAQGRDITGNVLYLGGPLTFFDELRYAFDDVLKTKGTCPENSLYYVSMGAALSTSSEITDIAQMAIKLASYSSSTGYVGCDALFHNEEEYKKFVERHEKDSENIKIIDAPSDKMYLGIDAGSTTIKALLCDSDGNIFNPSYLSNSGNPVPIIKQYLDGLYEKYPDINIVSSCVTGYGEDIIKNAFSLDMGIVETLAHYTAAKKFRPNVDFIIDIGGQDIKCFKIHNGNIDSLFLNEACSSGCGSFLQTFAGVLGYDMQTFAKLGLYAEKPVDLGSRCTVFMNSSVKQAQKDGASIENISAGLSISVVKNALYKVIRLVSSDALGENIVVQGGTFLNDAVLRAFEQETSKEVIRPKIAGLMGAYGSALFAMEKSKGIGVSTVLRKDAIDNFTHNVTAITCKGCSNHCKLTVNDFGSGRKFIAGNRCEKPIKGKVSDEKYDMYEYKNSLLDKYRTNDTDPSKPTIGIPMGLNLYELLPFWHTLFTNLGFNVVVSDKSTHALYLKGQHTIPSDTVCYPAKLVHGHIESLLEKGVDCIFYPCMSYNFDENLGDNHYNCPVVAYYPKVIGANVKALKNVKFINDFVGIHERKSFIPRFCDILKKYGFEFTKKQVKSATDMAYAEYEKHMDLLSAKAKEFMEIAKKENKPIIVLAGRPYHTDPETNHGISTLICNLGAVVVTEDAIARHMQKFSTNVLNQWTYHSRLYASAKFVAESKDENISLVQLVSFGCGVDAITTDETRSIVEGGGKVYTQIKIDEITNLGAVKIRLRSLFAILNKDR